MALWPENSFFCLVKGICEKFTEGASLVSVASVSGMMAEPKRTAYVSSKHALIGLTKCLAVELADRKIRANAVAPGVIETPLTESYFSDSNMLEKIKKAHLLGRAGLPEEVSEVVSFLLSDKSSFITGSVIHVDGGWASFKDI